MPSRSAKQERTMRAAAHNKEFADKVDIPQKVAREFEDEDKKKKKKEAAKAQAMTPEIYQALHGDK